MHRVHSCSLATVLGVACMAGSAAFAQTAQAQKAISPTNSDTEFVQKAAAAGRMEVEHGKMAASKASNAQVKAYASTLVKDHTAANQELMTIAKRKNITIAEQPAAAHGTKMAGGSSATTTSATKPGATRTATSGTTGTTGASGGVETTGEARDRQARGHGEPWMSATGAAFDRGFIDAQVKAHQEAITLFEKQANGSGDADLKAIAQKQLPGLRNHLKQAQDLQGKLGTN